MTDHATQAQVLPDPDTKRADGSKAIWMHGLWLVVMAVLFQVSKVVLFVSALVQFGWQLFKHERNRPIAEFGVELAEWQAAAARFLTGASTARPFPFAKWGAVEEE